MPAQDVIIIGWFEISSSYVDSMVIKVCESELPFNYNYDGISYSFNHAIDTVLATKCKASTIGRDSLLMLQLIVNPVFEIRETQTICDGSFYEWQGSYYSKAGEYTVTLTSVNSCDSILHLVLNVTPRFAVNYYVDDAYLRTDSVCVGDTLVLFRPKKDNYTFSGWGNVPETMPAEDLTLTGYFTYKPTSIIIGQDTISNDTVGMVAVNDEGTMFYDADENTLTMDSAVIENEGITSDVDNFTLSVENNSTITVEDFGIQYTGDSLTISTSDSSMLYVTSQQPISGNGDNYLYINGNVIFRSQMVSAQEVGKRRVVATIVVEGDSMVMVAAVSGFKDVVLAEGIQVCAVRYMDEDGNIVKGDPSRAVYHAAESAYGEIDVDTQSFVPATTLVFADSNFYTDYIDGKIDIGDDATGLFPVVEKHDTYARKVIIEGKIYVVRNGVWYTILGRRLR